MLELIITTLATQIPKSVISELFKVLSKWSLQRAIRRAVVDLVLDEVEDMLEEKGVPQEEIRKILKKREDKVEKETKIRIGAIFKAIKS